MKTLTAFLLLPFLCCFAPPVAAELHDISLIQLIAHPESYHGKLVRVIGFVRIEFEGNAIYLHEGDYKHSLNKNGLWIDITNEMRKKKEELNEKYLLLEGTFNAKETGHLGMWSGSIQNISRFQVWSEKEGAK